MPRIWIAPYIPSPPPSPTLPPSPVYMEVDEPLTPDLPNAEHEYKNWLLLYPQVVRLHYDPDDVEDELDWISGQIEKFDETDFKGKNKFLEGECDKIPLRAQYRRIRYECEELRKKLKEEQPYQDNGKKTYVPSIPGPKNSSGSVQNMYEQIYRLKGYIIDNAKKR